MVLIRKTDGIVGSLCSKNGCFFFGVHRDLLLTSRGVPNCAANILPFFFFLFSFQYPLSMFALYIFFYTCPNFNVIVWELNI